MRSSSTRSRRTLGRLVALALLGATLATIQAPPASAATVEVLGQTIATCQGAPGGAAQTFTPTQSGNITAVRVKYFKTNSIPAQISIWAGRPGTSLLYSDNTVTWETSQWYEPYIQTVPITPGVPVVAGTTYSFSVTGGQIFLNCTSDAYADGSALEYVRGYAVWHDYPGWDLVFEVVIEIPDPCPVGTYSASGFAPCDPAPPGFFVDTTGATAATPAPIGTYIDFEGAAAPVACPAGTTTLAIASASADDCVPIDTDGDGVPDVDDLCPATTLPDTDAGVLGTKKNRFVADETGSFGDSGYTVGATGGCNAAQIIEAAQLGSGHTKFGISRGELQEWVANL